MNKGFLVLEDGRVISGHTDLACNAFGEVQLSESQALLNDGVFTADSVIATGDDRLLGKIVVDTLPLEFHMYDVKSAVRI